MFQQPKDAGDAKVKAKQQQAYAKALADGKQVDWGEGGQPSLAEQLSASNPGPYYKVEKVVHPSEDGMPGYTTYKQRVSIWE